MPKYNLDALGSEEFEHLCQALVLEIIGPGAKVYGMGKDGAREATFHGKAPYPSEKEQWDGDWIFQAKFHDVQQIGPKRAREALLEDLDDELSKITQKYKHPCDNYILMTNVSLTPALQTGTRDRIDNEIIPKYHSQIQHIHVWGGEDICRDLDRHSDIRQTYAHFLVSGDIIARLLRMLEEKETDFDEFVKLYCQWCFDHEQYAALDDAGDVEDERVALQRVFIDLDVKPPSLPTQQQVLERLPEWLRQAAEDEDRTSALSYLLDDSIPGLVLIGGPGSGKSTLGQYVAQIYRARLIGKLNELSQSGNNVAQYENCVPRIPFRVLLREYAQWISAQREREEPDSLFHYLAVQASEKSASDRRSQDIQSIVKSDPVLLILDGLDEVPEKALRTSVIDNITSFANQVGVLKGNLRVVATTRPYGYSDEFDPSRCLHLTLQNLEPRRAVDYAQRWTDAREPNPGEAERIRATFHVCLKDRVVSVLTQTPLQVTILLVIIRAEGSPPKQREELFNEYMNIIYRREQKSRPELLRTEKDTIYGLHKYLAYILHRRAEKDRTAALMDMSEFEEKVRGYLAYTDPLLNEEELEDKVNQIIEEASQRLVLIESPQEGVIGFGLTTTREFFTAAHLVDTAESSAEIDARLRAIARSPYWRNVALFFAGRVGRTRQGEAPSMVDVCRDIDTGTADRFLKRGAELVTEMVGDRVLRVPHNEIGALKYALEMLDAGLISDFDDWVNRLKGLPEGHKERVILPWIEERLRSVVPEKLELYAEAYQQLFGLREPLERAIQQAAEYDSKDVKLWALSQAIRNRIVEPWVTQLLEELVKVFPTRRIGEGIADCWFNLRYYLDFPLSPKGRTVFAYALSERSKTPLVSPPKIIEELSKIKPEGKSKENSLFMWSMSQLLMLPRVLSGTLLIGSGVRITRQEVALELPGIANPVLRTWVDENTNSIEEFCESFSQENEPFTKDAVRLFEFLLKPDDFDRFTQLLDIEKNVRGPLATILSSLDIGGCPGDEEKLREYHEHLYHLYGLYESGSAYRRDLEELNGLVNKQSANVSDHPHRLYIWITSGCSPVIEDRLDSGILNELKTWLGAREFPTDLLHLRRMTAPSDLLEICELALDAVEIQLAEKQRQLTVPLEIMLYERRGVKRERDSKFASRLKDVLEKVLADYPILVDPQHRQLGLLCQVALGARVLEEKHMPRLYEVFGKDPATTPWTFWYVSGTEKALPMLMGTLRSDDPKVARLSALLLLGVLRGIRFSPGERSRVIKRVWVGEKLWELAQNRGDAWQSQYVEGMAFCRLKWSRHSEQWLEAIRGARTPELRGAWGEVIEAGTYSTTKDREALNSLLLCILDSRDDFAKSIQIAALRRLRALGYEVEGLEFDESPLGLPLPRR